ncbi:MAG: hypothetical protein JST00_29805 [Deltaproteobacteria bacterium]|nr:hypothetical protein [Deltaproteobacteria bacterium]
MIAGGLSLVIGVQAVACTQPSGEAVGSSEAALQASVTVGGRRVAPPSIDRAMLEQGAASIRAQSAPGETTQWAETNSGRRVVILQQSQAGNTVSARGYFVDPGGKQVPFEITNLSVKDAALEAQGIAPKITILGALVIVVVLVVIIVVTPPVVNSAMCSARSTDDCRCQKRLPEPSKCIINANGTDSGVEACVEVVADDEKCMCFPTKTDGGVDPATCDALADD